MPVQKLFDLSSAHLSSDSRAWLSEHATMNHAAAYHGFGDGAALSTLGALRCGWFLHAPENPEDYLMPSDLVTIVRLARSEDCLYILIDSEAPLIDGLPILDEDLDPQDFTSPGDDSEADDDDSLTCDECGEEYDEGGDGYDGKCPDCADRKFNCDDGQNDNQLDPENRAFVDDGNASGEFQVDLRQYVEMTTTVRVIASDKGVAASIALDKARGGYVDVEWHQGDDVRFLDVVEVKIPE